MRLALFALLASCSFVPQPRTYELETSEPRSPRPRAHVLELGWDGERFTLENISKAEQIALPALDGSTRGVRMPLVKLEYRNSDGVRLQPPRSRGFCGNLNALREQDFKRLQPGERMPLHPWGSSEPPDGAIEQRLIYDTHVHGTRPFGDREDISDIPSLAKLPEGVWVSDWVEL